MRKDVMIQFDGWLAKQGISYKDHGEAMAALSNIDEMKMMSVPCWNLGAQDLLEYAKRDLERYGAQKFQNAVDYYEAVLDNKVPKLDMICFEDDTVPNLIAPKHSKFTQLQLEVA